MIQDKKIIQQIKIFYNLETENLKFNIDLRFSIIL